MTNRSCLTSRQVGIVQMNAEIPVTPPEPDASSNTDSTSVEEEKQDEQPDNVSTSAHESFATPTIDGASNEQEEQDDHKHSCTLEGVAALSRAPSLEASVFTVS